MAKTEVAKVEEKLPSVVYDYGDDTGSGFENMSSKDMIIPWWNLLQGGSPAVKNEMPPDAKEGMLLNSVTMELVKRDVGVPVVPVYTEKAYVKWDPAKRIEGGGFMGIYDPDDEYVKETLKRAEDLRKSSGKISVPKTDDGMDLVETHYLYCLDLDEDTIGEDDQFDDPKAFSVIAFKSTGIRPFQTALSAVRMVKRKPPLYAFRWRIGSEKKTNDKGTFAIPRIWPAVGSNYVDSLIPPSSALFESAKLFRTQIIEGIARVDHSQQESSSSGDDSPTRRKASDVGDDEAPF